MNKHKVSYHLALIIANMLFGLNFSIFISIISKYMPFQSLFFLRVLFSAIFFLPFTFSSKRYDISIKNFIKILIPTVIVIYGHEFMMLWGTKYTNPTDSSIISTLGPVATLVVSAILLNEKIHIAKIIGIILAIAGTSVLIFGKGIPVSKSEEIGNLFILISVVAAATNTIFIKPELMRLGTLTVTGWYYIIGVFISAPFYAKGVFEFDFTTLHTEGWIELIYILIIGSMLPNYLLYYGTEHLTSVHTGLYAYLQPLTATIVGILRGQVILGYDMLISSILIFIGVLLVVKTYVKYKFPIPKIEPDDSKKL